MQIRLSGSQRECERIAQVLRNRDIFANAHEGRNGVWFVRGDAPLAQLVAILEEDERYPNAGINPKQLK